MMQVFIKIATKIILFLSTIFHLLIKIVTTIILFLPTIYFCIIIIGFSIATLGLVIKIIGLIFISVLIIIVILFGWMNTKILSINRRNYTYYLCSVFLQYATAFAIVLPFNDYSHNFFNAWCWKVGENRDTPGCPVVFTNVFQEKYLQVVGEFSNSIDSLLELEYEYLDISKSSLYQSIYAKEYDYSTHDRGLYALTYGISRQDTFKSHVGIIINSDLIAPSENTRVEIVCESKLPGKIIPTQPIGQNGVIKCGGNTRKFDTYGKPIKVGQDFELAYNSIRHAEVGQYQQALTIANTIKNTDLQKQALNVIDRYRQGKFNH